MALLMTEGWDWIQPTWSDTTNNANMLKMGWFDPAFMSVGGTGRYGGQCLYTFANYGVLKTFSSTGGAATIVAGIAVKVEEGYISFRLRNSAINSTGVRIDVGASGYIGVSAGSAYNRSLGGQFYGAEWCYVEVKVVASLTSGTVVCRVNGAEVISLSGLQTLPTGSVGYLDQFAVGGISNSGNGWYDDIYVCDTAPGGPSDFLGPVRVQTLFPTAAGDVTQMQPSNMSVDNWQLASNPNINDATYVYGTNGTSYYDLYQGGDVLGVSSVYGVRPVSVARQTDAAPTQTKNTAIKTNGSTFFGAGTSATSNYVYADTVYGLNPATGVPWTAAEVNALQFGPKQG